MHERVFWRGTHATLGWGAPLGKLHPDGLKLLRERGWREVPCDHATSLPAFCWNTRKALDLPALGGDLPLIRLLPQGSTDAVDDKVRCAELMAAADVMPETHTEPQRTLAAAAAAAPERLWFVKHRLGVKGRAVRPMRGEELASWLDTLPPANREFAVQAGVPPALYQGRKFALRCHALVACRCGAPPAAWLHRDVIALPHASPYDADDRAAHISQAGRRHPPPQLTAELPSDHPAAAASLWPRLQSLMQRSLDAARPALMPPEGERCASSHLYALLGCDV